jgi:hypothetical protein
LNEKELKALVSLLEDEDFEVIKHVEDKIISIGSEVIPFLEKEWEGSFNPTVQRKIEDLIHTLQFEFLKVRLQDWVNSGAQDLLEGVWIVTTYQYPDLELSFLRKEIEQLFYEVWTEFKQELPISLSIIYILIAQKLGLPVYGVNLPNLFICTYKSEEQQFYINPFNKGLIFSKSDIENYVQQLHLNPMDLFFEPCDHVDIIKRILRNLIISFEKIGDYPKSDEVKQLLASIDGDLQDSDLG